jgi:hypothetical protein
LTVTGIWRVYEGPVGCGKEPPDGTVWYLEVDRIVEPNPLVGSGGPGLTVVAGTQQPVQGLLDNDPTSTPGLTITPTVESLVTVPITTGTAVPAPPLTVTATLTLPPTTPLPGLSPTSSVTPTPSPTTGAGTPTAGTGTPQGTTTPGLPTGTPSGTGYPGQPTPPNGYP